MIQIRRILDGIQGTIYHEYLARSLGYVHLALARKKTSCQHEKYN